MIDCKLKYQASIFLNASDMGATPQNISSLMTEFMDKGFIPTVFQEINVSNPQPQNRFALQSSNNEWRINFASMRIDIEKNPTDFKGNNMGTESDFCNTVKDFYSRILRKYPKKANRLAFVSRFLLNEMSDDTLNLTYTKLFNAPLIYRDNIPFEWNWRTVAKLEKDICTDYPETFNYVSSINRVNGEVVEGNNVRKLDRIELSIDINTIPTRIDERFDNEMIGHFLENVPIWHEELKNSLLDFIR